jgi:hypothetical protein
MPKWNEKSEAHKKYEEQRSRTIDLIEGQDEIRESPKDESEILEESKDQTPDEWIEEAEDTTAPIEKAGSPENPKQLRDTRFAREHPVIVDRESTLKSKKVAKLDTPSDED